MGIRNGVFGNAELLRKKDGGIMARIGRFQKKMMQISYDHQKTDRKLIKMEQSLEEVRQLLDSLLQRKDKKEEDTGKNE